MYKYDLLKLLPQYYRTSSVMADTLAPMEQELQRLLLFIIIAERQMQIATATGEALARYEEELDIVPNTSESDEERRNRVIARKNGTSATTEETLKRTVNLYVSGEIAINTDSANSTVTIEFLTHIGVPTNIDEVKKSISEIIPAHLLVEYIYHYRTWSEYTSSTWGQLTGYTWGQLQTREGEL